MPNTSEKNAGQYDIYDEALRVIYLNTVLKSNKRAVEMARILTLSGKDLPPQRQKQLVALLAEKSATDTLTLGKLLTSALKTKKARSSDAVKSALFLMPKSFVAAIKKDRKYPNTIPLFTLKALLNALQIPYSVAETAIWATFKKLQQAPAASISALALYNRRGNLLQDRTGLYLQSSIGEKHFFEDEQSLKKYLNELSQIL